MPLPPLITNAVLPFNMPVITSPCSDAWISQHTVRIMTTEAPLIPVSWGELADKVSILEIKCARLRAPDAVANAARELAALTAMLAPVAKTIPVERSDLTAVATRLWEIENAIREKEAARDFGDAFVALDAPSTTKTMNVGGSRRRPIASCDRSGGRDAIFTVLIGHGHTRYL